MQMPDTVSAITRIYSTKTSSYGNLTRVMGMVIDGSVDASSIVAFDKGGDRIPLSDFQRVQALGALQYERQNPGSQQSWAI